MQNEEPTNEPNNTGNDFGSEANYTTTDSSQDLKDEVKSFLTNSLPQIVKAIFSSPIEGTKEVFAAHASSAFVNGLILICVNFIVSLGLGLLIALDTPYSDVDIDILLRSALTATLPLLFIVLLVFGLKSIAGKADLKNEMLTGGLCGLILSITMVLVYVFVQLSGGAMNMLSFLMGSGNIFVLLFFVFSLLFMVNIVQQSLRGSGTKDTLAWYMSPAIVLLSFYISFQVADKLF